MSFRALVSCGVFRSNAFSSQDVLLAGDRLKVKGVAAIAVSAQVVKVKAFVSWVLKKLVYPSMQIKICFVNPYFGVSVKRTTRIQPAFVRVGEVCHSRKKTSNLTNSHGLLQKKNRDGYTLCEAFPRLAAVDISVNQKCSHNLLATVI
jgi:hypothetical protein